MGVGGSVCVWGGGEWSSKGGGKGEKARSKHRVAQSEGDGAGCAPVGKNKGGEHN